MIDLSKVRNFYVACGYTDLRFGIDGLAAVVTQQFGGHLDEESLFLFCGRRTDRIKALYFLPQVPKMFADCYYVPEMSKYEFDYQIVSFEDSLKRLEITDANRRMK